MEPKLSTDIEVDIVEISGGISMSSKQPSLVFTGSGKSTSSRLCTSEIKHFLLYMYVFRSINLHNVNDNVRVKIGYGTIKKIFNLDKSRICYL